MIIFKAFFNPVFIKILVLGVLVAIFFRIINILIERKLKTIKPIQLKSSTLSIIAVVLFILALVLLKYL